MSGPQRVEGSLCDADVALDADQHNVSVGLEGRSKRGEPHAEEGLVGLSADVRRREERSEVGHDGAEARGVLGRGVDGDLERLRGAEDFLGGEDAGAKGVGGLC